MSKAQIVKQLHAIASGQLKNNLGPLVKSCNEQYSADIDNIEVISNIHTSGEATVLKVLNESVGRNEILKIAHPNLGQKALKRFDRSAQVLAKLNSYRLFPIIYNYCDKKSCILMEYVDGITLSKYIQQESLSVDEIINIWTQACRSVQCLHDEKVCHRDLKPDNIMIRVDGSLCILDFGMAKSPSSVTLTQTGESLGTPFYMSPEQLFDPANADWRTDIYSLSMILYTMLSGGEEEYDPRQIPPMYIPIISRAMEYNLNLRPQSCEDFATEVEEISGIKEKPEITREMKIKVNDEVDYFKDVFVFLGGNLHKVAEYCKITSKEAAKLLERARKRIARDAN